MGLDRVSAMNPAAETRTVKIFMRRNCNNFNNPPRCSRQRTRLLGFCWPTFSEGRRTLPFPWWFLRRDNDL
jgi:hypothetical protein